MLTSSQPARSPSTRFLFFLTLTLLAICFISIYHLTRESMAYDEGWSLWAVRPIETSEMITRVAADVHPPMYFLALDGWVAQVGEADAVVRLFSVAGALIGAAATFALGRQLFDRWTGWIALAVLGTTSFFVYYAREARMYSWLFALTSLSMWAYWRWRQRPSRRDTLIYALSIAVLFYTHYYGLLIAASQVLHLLLVSPKQIGRWLWCGGFALLFIAPWLPVWSEQVRLHPHGPLAQPTPTTEATVTWLLLMLTSGLSIWIAAPFVVGRALLQVPRHRSTLLLLILWLLLTPITVLAANAYIAPLYQPRYLIGSLPALSLLIAYGLRHVCWKPLAAILLIGLVSVQLLAYPAFWPDRPQWKEAISKVIAARHPGGPTLALIAPQSIEAYYDRQLGLRDAQTIDLAERVPDFAELHTLINSLQDEPSVWIVLPTNVGATWDIAALLDRERQVGYRDSVVNVIFYRFDRGTLDSRSFRFGNNLRLEAAQADRAEAQPGDTICVTLTLTVLNSLGQEYSAGLHLVNETNALIAQQDSGLGALSIGQPFDTIRCVEIPAQASAGTYYLHWVIYDWTNGERLPVLEGNGAGVFWGDAYIVGRVELKPSH